MGNSVSKAPQITPPSGHVGAAGICGGRDTPVRWAPADQQPRVLGTGIGGAGPAGICGALGLNKREALDLQANAEGMPRCYVMGVRKQYTLSNPSYGPNYTFPSWMALNHKPGDTTPIQREVGLYGGVSINHEKENMQKGMYMKYHRSSRGIKQRKQQGRLSSLSPSRALATDETR
jgi:hypothetical protein